MPLDKKHKPRSRRPSASARSYNLRSIWNGSLPFIHAELKGRSSMDTSIGTNTPCPRPLSRKKLRSLIRDNRGMLTSSALASTLGRTPGRGRTKNRLARALREMDHRYADPAKRPSMMMQLRSLFSAKPTGNTKKA